MNVINLLIKIAKGEKVPKKITIGNSDFIFEWNGNMYVYEYKDKYGNSEISIPDYIHNLNEKVNILEEGD